MKLTIKEVDTITAALEAKKTIGNEDQIDELQAKVSSLVDKKELDALREAVRGHIEVVPGDSSDRTDPMHY